MNLTSLKIGYMYSLYNGARLWMMKMGMTQITLWESTRYIFMSVNRLLVSEIKDLIDMIIFFSRVPSTSTLQVRPLMNSR